MDTQTDLTQVVLEKVSDSVAEYTPLVVPKVRVDANEIQKQIDSINANKASVEATLTQYNAELAILQAQLDALASAGVTPVAEVVPEVAPEVVPEG